MGDITTSYWQRKAGEDWQHIVSNDSYDLLYINGVLQEPMRVLNKKYWPHQFRISNKDVAELERWCYDNIKHSGDWRNYGKMFAFKRQDDATLFALKWT